MSEDEAERLTGLKLKKKYRVVRDGMPGMDGVYKTIQIGGPFNTAERAEQARETLARLGHGHNTRVQTCWATEWRDE